MFQLGNTLIIEPWFHRGRPCALFLRLPWLGEFWLGKQP